MTYQLLNIKTGIPIAAFGMELEALNAARKNSATFSQLALVIFDEGKPLAGITGSDLRRAVRQGAITQVSLAELILSPSS